MLHNVRSTRITQTKQGQAITHICVTAEHSSTARVTYGCDPTQEWCKFFQLVRLSRVCKNNIWPAAQLLGQLQQHVAVLAPIHNCAFEGWRRKLGRRRGDGVTAIEILQSRLDVAWRLHHGLSLEHKRIFCAQARSS